MELHRTAGPAQRAPTEMRDKTNRRTGIYMGVSIALCVGSVVLRGPTWQGSRELHTIMEAIATLLALMVGMVALLRFYTKQSDTFLFLGTGFLGTALLDGYHALVTSQWFDQLWPSPPPSLIPWSWNASRGFLAPPAGLLSRTGLWSAAGVPRRHLLPPRPYRLPPQGGLETRRVRTLGGPLAHRRPHGPGPVYVALLSDLS